MTDGQKFRLALADFRRAAEEMNEIWSRMDSDDGELAGRGYPWTISASFDELPSSIQDWEDKVAELFHG